MPRRRSRKGSKPLQEINTAGVNNKSEVEKPDCEAAIIPEILGIRSILDHDECQPSTSSKIADNLSSNTAALYDELDSFRQRWKRELEVTKVPDSKDSQPNAPDSLHGGKKYVTERLDKLELSAGDENNENTTSTPNNTTSKSRSSAVKDNLYEKAKKLFTIAVGLEQDEMHHESIRYYKQAMHLCPDIEKLIFREQCAESARLSAINKDNDNSENKLDNLKRKNQSASGEGDESDDNKLPLYDRILQSYNEANTNDVYVHCKSSHKQKSGTIHMSDLPHELILQIFRYVIGTDLDLASLEVLGLVCRGFYLLSKDPSLWRSICYATWGDSLVSVLKQRDLLPSDVSKSQINWHQMFLERPRVNYDGVYISRTRYIRQGDVGFQDLTYRPFHVIRYYRYIRFFPDKRVLILTTNEEPDRVIPIFRQASHAKQFSPDLSILEGTFEFETTNQISITAEKDCLEERLANSTSRRRPAHLHWSRQSPISQRFDLRFELKTAENKPYKNNVLKWLEYTILSRMEMGQETVDSFDLTPDTFPNLIFARVKRLSLKLTNPLSSH